MDLGPLIEWVRAHGKQKYFLSLFEFALYICWQLYRALKVIASVDIPTETLRTVLQPFLFFQNLKRLSLGS